jgi:hypothetical protein
MTPVALCDFHPVTGWRVRGLSHSDHEKISVISIGKLKLLRLPVKTPVIAGAFCNPRKIARI